jgi:hypothetical protein
VKDDAVFRTPKTKSAAEVGALIEYPKRKLEERAVQRVRVEDITVCAVIGERRAAMAPKAENGGKANIDASPDSILTELAFLIMVRL